MLNWSEIINLAFKSIWRNKTRSTLTMLGVIIGVGSVIILVALGQGIQKFITQSFESLGANLVTILPGRVDPGSFSGPPNFSGSKLTLDLVDQIARLGNPIVDSGAGIENPASIKHKEKTKYTIVAGVTNNYLKLRNVTVAQGREFTKGDVELSRNVVILGKSMVTELFGNSEPVGKTISIGDSKFEVIGVLQKVGASGGGIGIDINNFIAIPITSAQRLFGQDSIQIIVVKAQNKDEIQNVIAKVENFMKNKLKEDDYTVLDSASLLGTINQILGTLTAALAGIAAISLVVGGVGIMNIMFVSVTERIKEIGLRKAVGAKQKDILFQFLIEAAALSGLGGIAGILFGWVVSLALNRFVATEVTFWAVGMSFGVSVLVGIVSGVAPAIKASKLDPIDALRYE